MSVGLLIITHGDIGADILKTATRVLGGCPLRAETLAVTEESHRDILELDALKLAQQVDTGEGVLILTDLFGSTPANIARSLQMRPSVRVLAGVNLPMLVRLFNYAHLPLAEIAAKAASGGKDGVVVCGEPERRGGGAQ
jgi:PTS system ascorbate-specific IIA component